LLNSSKAVKIAKIVITFENVEIVKISKKLPAAIKKHNQKKKR
jgi:hypothetical protein